MTSFTDVDWEDIVKAFLIIHAAWKKSKKTLSNQILYNYI